MKDDGARNVEGEQVALGIVERHISCFEVAIAAKVASGMDEKFAQVSTHRMSSLAKAKRNA